MVQFYSHAKPTGSDAANDKRPDCFDGRKLSNSRIHVVGLVVTMHWSVYKLCWVVIRKGIEDIYDAGSR